MAARSRRFARLRFTAVPTVRPAATPTCTSDTSFALATSTTRGWAKDLPERRTRLKSSDRVRRNLRCTHASAAQEGRPDQARRTALSDASFGSYQRVRLTCSLDRGVSL